MSNNFDLSSYKTVPQRLAEFRERFPDGRLCAADPAHPYYVETIGNQSYVVYAAAAYRSPEDTRPGIGVAWECVPGKTPYTKDSELQNAETSAWGRALVAALIVDPGASVASQEDVRNRQSSTTASTRLDLIRAAVVDKGATPWVNAQKFDYPWDDATCDAIEAHLETTQ